MGVISFVNYTLLSTFELNKDGHDFHKLPIKVIRYNISCLRMSYNENKLRSSTSQNYENYLKQYNQIELDMSNYK